MNGERRPGVRAWAWSLPTTVLVFLGALRGLWTLPGLIGTQVQSYLFTEQIAFQYALIDLAVLAAACLGMMAGSLVLARFDVRTGPVATLVLVVVLMCAYVGSLRPEVILAQVIGGIGVLPLALRLSLLCVGAALGRAVVAGPPLLSLPVSVGVASVLLCVLPPALLLPLSTETVGNTAADAREDLALGLMLAVAISVAVAGAVAAGTSLARGGTGPAPLVLAAVGGVLTPAVMWLSAVIMRTGLAMNPLIAVPVVVTSAAAGGCAVLLAPGGRRRAAGRGRPYRLYG